MVYAGAMMSIALKKATLLVPHVEAVKDNPVTFTSLVLKIIRISTNFLLVS